MVEAPEIPVLDPAAAYALWAPSYDRETAVSLLEDTLVAELTPLLAGRRLLDVGCGTGRRLAIAGAGSVTGIEPSREMIAAGAASRTGRSDLTILEGHAGDLPLNAGSFDVAWCRLVLGHLDDLERPYAEMARVLVCGGTLIVSDFHPEAHACGHRRTFRSSTGVCEIESHPHPLAAHILAAEDVGLVLLDGTEALVGPPVRQLYTEAGRLASYDEQLGLPLVFALKFQKG